MPEDLRTGPGVTLVSMFGNSSRFTGVDPRCVLFADASLSAGTFQLRPNCMEQSGRSIVQQMNDLIAKGVVITTGLEEGALLHQPPNRNRCIDGHCNDERLMIRSARYEGVRNTRRAVWQAGLCHASSL